MLTVALQYSYNDDYNDSYHLQDRRSSRHYVPSYSATSHHHSEPIWYSHKDSLLHRDCKDHQCRADIGFDNFDNHHDLKPSEHRVGNNDKHSYQDRDCKESMRSHSLIDRKASACDSSLKCAMYISQCSYDKALQHHKDQGLRNINTSGT